ncbi:putative mitochondrial chaperone bcs1 [Morella rubra]|uniref:Putative mitochondrial chaperone bcs1 n=1 Tax=Morella rubra TaxID=262757 RepID=A0A6A1W112_9ROSI|nr:putative mitochondrial chaperone bcs1 [Morella rubra]
MSFPKENQRKQSKNELFAAVHAYLGTKLTPDVHRIKVSKAEEQKKLAVTVDRDEEIVDVYEDVQVSWILVCTEAESSGGINRGRRRGDLNAYLRSETRSYKLTFYQKHREKVLNSYLPYILERAKNIKEESRAIKLHTVAYDCWDPNTINLDHPMNFTTLAMDSELKEDLMNDLDRFLNGKEFYKRTGKAWKRGYLLYGPPGTGKSSLIAAMANHLNYDIYDLDLAAVISNSHLRALLLGMSSRSILVVEDIDCTIKLPSREPENESGNNHKNQVTLSGLLNFIDGLWSCCGQERIIVFTTNHKDRLDPALLRPGRMDKRIHMSYCTVSAFKQLAFNYHRISHHQLFGEIGGLISEVKVTPAEVAGELMKGKDADISFQGLVKFLQDKKIQHEKPGTDKEV